MKTLENSWFVFHMKNLYCSPHIFTKKPINKLRISQNFLTNRKSFIAHRLSCSWHQTTNPESANPALFFMKFAVCFDLGFCLRVKMDPNANIAVCFQLFASKQTYFREKNRIRCFMDWVFDLMIKVFDTCLFICYCFLPKMWWADQK